MPDYSIATELKNSVDWMSAQRRQAIDILDRALAQARELLLDDVDDGALAMVAVAISRVSANSYQDNR